MTGQPLERLPRTLTPRGVAHAPRRDGGGGGGEAAMASRGASRGARAERTGEPSEVWWG